MSVVRMTGFLRKQPRGERQTLIATGGRNQAFSFRAKDAGRDVKIALLLEVPRTIAIERALRADDFVGLGVEQVELDARRCVAVAVNAQEPHASTVARLGLVFAAWARVHVAYRPRSVHRVCPMAVCHFCAAKHTLATLWDIVLCRASHPAPIEMR